MKSKRVVSAGTHLRLVRSAEQLFSCVSLRALVVIALVICVMCGTGVVAGTVNLADGNALGESWLTAADWVPAGVPAGGNDYVVAIASLRSPVAVDPVFGGDSLAINAGGMFWLKHTGTVTVADLRLNGGQIVTAEMWPQGLAGRIAVNSHSTLGIASASYRLLLSSEIVSNRNLTIFRFSEVPKDPFVVLLNDNPGYSGNWIINAGTGLQVGDGGVAGGLGSGNVTNNGALVFNRSGEYAVSNMISSTGTVTVTGGGVVTFSGTNTYSGVTFVSNAALFVNGSLSNSVVTVSSGGVLGGGGFLGTVAITNGAAITGGGTNTAGILTVGDLTLCEGAMVNWNYEKAVNTADVVNVTGNLTLPTNATLNVSGTGGWFCRKVMFSAATISGATNLSSWGLNGTPHAAQVVVEGNEVLLLTPPTGTVIFMR